MWYIFFYFIIIISLFDKFCDFKERFQDIFYVSINRFVCSKNRHSRKGTIPQIRVWYLINCIRDWWWFNLLLLTYVCISVINACFIRFWYGCSSYGLISLIILFYLWIHIGQSNFLKFTILNLISPRQAVVESLYPIGICNGRDT